MLDTVQEPRPKYIEYNYDIVFVILLILYDITDLVLIGLGLDFDLSIITYVGAWMFLIGFALQPALLFYFSKGTSSLALFMYLVLIFCKWTYGIGLMVMGDHYDKLIIFYFGALIVSSPIIFLFCAILCMIPVCLYQYCGVLWEYRGVLWEYRCKILMIFLAIVGICVPLTFILLGYVITGLVLYGLCFLLSCGAVLTLIYFSNKEYANSPPTPYDELVNSDKDIENNKPVNSDSESINSDSESLNTYGILDRDIEDSENIV